MTPRVRVSILFCAWATEIPTTCFIKTDRLGSGQPTCPHKLCIKSGSHMQLPGSSVILRYMYPSGYSERIS